MKAYDVKVGDLIRVHRYGLATVMKFFAPAYIGVVLVEGPDAGTWLYLRGFDLQKAELIK